MDGPAASSQHPPAACTLQEAATLLGVSINTLRRKIAAGQVRAEQVARPQGHVWRVYLDGRQHAGQHAAEPADSTLQEPPGSRLQQPPTDLQRAEAMAAYSTALLAPLVAELATTRVKLVEQAETIGRQAERITTLEAHFEQRAQNAQEGTQASNLGAEAPGPPAEPSDPPVEPQPSPVLDPLPPTTDGRQPWWRRWWVGFAGPGMWAAFAGVGVALVLSGASCQVFGP